MFAHLLNRRLQCLSYIYCISSDLLINCSNCLQVMETLLVGQRQSERKHAWSVERVQVTPPEALASLLEDVPANLVVGRV